MYEKIATVKSNELGVVKYYVVTNKYENTDIYTYGVAIEQSGNTDVFAEYSDLDVCRERIIEFIKLLAKCSVTCCTLKDVCEDYVEAMCDF